MSPGRTPRQPLSVKRPGKRSGAADARSRLAPSAGKTTRARGAPPVSKLASPSVKLGGRANAVVSKSRKGAPVAARSRPPADPEQAWAGLHALYPDAHCELDFTSPWELLVATILSAQCTDRRVNMVTPVLFRRFPGPEQLAAADPAEVEGIIRSTGFFRAKTKSIMGAAAVISERHGGAVPGTMAELVELPGVGRKTANVVLGNAFGRDEGVVVDTHVARVSRRLGLTLSEDPIEIERALMRLYARDRWTLLSHLLIWHGRRLCHARRPVCEDCPLSDICPSSLV